MSGVYALFADPDAAERAVEALRAQGLGTDEITIISAQPYESYAFSHTGGSSSWMFRVAAAGGTVGLACAFALTSLTQRAWPINTGGMPIVALWTNLIIMFEMTMLGAVLSTVGTLLWSTGLPRRRPAFYDPAVSTGAILVGVEQPKHASPVLATTLARAGGQVKTLA